MTGDWREAARATLGQLQRPAATWASRTAGQQLSQATRLGGLLEKTPCKVKQLVQSAPARGGARCPGRSPGAPPPAAACQHVGRGCAGGTGNGRALSQLPPPRGKEKHSLLHPGPGGSDAGHGAASPRVRFSSAGVLRHAAGGTSQKSPLRGKLSRDTHLRGGFPTGEGPWGASRLRSCLALRGGHPLPACSYQALTKS